MKYYELYEKYKRSAYFFYSEENKIDSISLKESRLHLKNPLFTK